VPSKPILTKTASVKDTISLFYPYINSLDIFTKLKFYIQMVQYNRKCSEYAYFLSAITLPLFTHKVLKRSDKILGSSVNRYNKAKIMLPLLIVTNSIILLGIQMMNHAFLLLMLMNSKCIDLNEILINNEFDIAVTNKGVHEILQQLNFKQNEDLIANKDLFLEYKQIINNEGLTKSVNIQNNYVYTFFKMIKCFRTLSKDTHQVINELNNFYGNIEMYLLQLSNKVNTKIHSYAWLNLNIKMILDYANYDSTLAPFIKIKDYIKHYNTKYLHQNGIADKFQIHLYKSYHYAFLIYLRKDNKKQVLKNEFEYNINLLADNTMSEFHQKYDKYKYILTDTDENEKFINFLNQHHVYPYKNIKRIPYYQFCHLRSEYPSEITQSWYPVTLVATCLVNYGLLKYLKIF
jgi:hypothetical protein